MRCSWQLFTNATAAIRWLSLTSIEPRDAVVALARQVNPFKLRQFARTSGVLAKNDPLDARTVASFVAIMPTSPA
jgi:hypothetical protein